MGSAGVEQTDRAVVDGLFSDDPLVRLLARQVQVSNDRAAELEAANEELRGEVARLSERLKRLQVKLEGARRAAKRQAAPFLQGHQDVRSETAGPQARPGLGDHGAAQAANARSGR